MTLRLSDIPRPDRHHYRPINLDRRATPWVWEPRVIECDHDHTHDLPVCPACARELVTALHDLPALMVDLEDAISRQTSFVDHGTTSAVVDDGSLPYNVAASDVAAGLREVLAWLPPMTGDRQQWATSAARTLLGHLGSAIAGADLTPETYATAVRTLTGLMVRAHQVIDRPKDLLPLGACPDPDCAADLWYERDKTVTQCRRCGTGYDVANVKAAALAAADDHWLPIDLLIGCAETAGTPITRTQLEHWIRTDGIPREKRVRPYLTDAGEIGHRAFWVYRLGDVLNRAAQANREAQMLTTNDAAGILGVTVEHVRRLVATGRLQPLRRGTSRLRFAPETITAYQRRPR